MGILVKNSKKNVTIDMKPKTMDVSRCDSFFFLIKTVNVYVYVFLVGLVLKNY